VTHPNLNRPLTAHQKAPDAPVNQLTPDRIISADGKSYPAQHQRRPRHNQPPQVRKIAQLTE
jgi:hypothetical protein